MSAKNKIKAAFVFSAVIALFLCLTSCGRTVAEETQNGPASAKSDANCNHVFGSWEVETSPTCTQEGVLRSKCGFCGKSSSQRIQHLGHSYSEEKVQTATCCDVFKKYRVCETCGQEDVLEEGEKDLSAHSFEVVAKKDASCERDGFVKEKCAGCGEEKTTVLPAVGHAYSSAWTVDVVPTCEKPGTMAHRCARCGVKKDETALPALGHRYGDWEETVLPTCLTSGEKERCCVECGKTEKQ